MKYLNALNKISGIGPQKIRRLLDFFQSPEQIWQADLFSLGQSQIGEKTALKIFEGKKELNPDTEWEKLQKENIQVLDFNDPLYPKILKEIANPPYLLYVKGSLDFNLLPSVAIVGARKCTAYGAQIAQKFAAELASAGICIVSGMALGIDSYAHQGALEAKNGKTIAVLGNSLDDNSIYPPNNFNLSREIIQNGALVSEYPIETLAGKFTFPARNRIIAGLAQGILIIEAGEKSGALITARIGLESNREIFSVPGSVFSPASIGTHNLLRSGAKIATCVKDILEELNLEENMKVKVLKKPTSREEDLIMKILSFEPTHIDNIVKITKLQTAIVSSVLSLMEIKGWVKNIGGQNYILIN